MAAQCDEVKANLIAGLDGPPRGLAASLSQLLVSIHHSGAGQHAMAHGRGAAQYRVRLGCEQRALPHQSVRRRQLEHPQHDVELMLAHVALL